MHDNKKQIFETLRKACLIMGSEQTTERMQLFTERLARHNPQTVDAAIMSICETSKFFPSLAEILQKIETPIDVNAEANEISAAIIKAVSTYGPDRWPEASASLGPSASATADRYGWQGLCQIQNSEVGMVRAQLRELAKSVLAKNTRGELTQFWIDESSEVVRKVLGNAPESLNSLISGAHTQILDKRHG